MQYLLHIAILVCIFTVLAVSLDLLAGHTGLLSIAHAAFYGLGAYVSALFVNIHSSFFLGLLAGIGMACLISLMVSIPSLRLHEDYFVIATLAFQMIFSSVFNNSISLTGGPLGISGIPPPEVFGWQLVHRESFLVLAIVVAFFGYWVVHRITSAPYGRVLHAIREDEVFAKALGKNTLYFKVSAFAVSAGLAAMSGSLYAHYITYIDPTGFTVMESILIICMVIIGGAGSLWGPLVGALVLVTLPELLRFIGLPSAIAANLRQVIYGALLVAMMLFRPRGLIGKYSFTSTAG